jgi:NAD(P)H dehydrogenase (quinone)
MKKVLIILGHPDNNSLNFSLADSLESEVSKSGHDCRRINLGDLDFNPNLKKGYKETQELEDDLKKSQEDILWSDYLIFVFPIWWYNLPGIFKGFIDRVFLPGFAFKYKNGIPRGLLKGKKSIIVCTSGSPSIVYFFIGNLASKVLSSTLGFCGIKNVKTKLFGLVERNVKKRGFKHYEKKMSKIVKLIK